MLLVTPVLGLDTMILKSGDGIVWAIGALVVTLRLENCGDNDCKGSITPGLAIPPYMVRMDEHDPVSIKVGITVELIKGGCDVAGHTEGDIVVTIGRALFDCCVVGKVGALQVIVFWLVVEGICTTGVASDAGKLGGSWLWFAGESIRFSPEVCCVQFVAEEFPGGNRESSGTD